MNLKLKTLTISFEYKIKLALIYFSENSFDFSLMQNSRFRQLF